MSSWGEVSEKYQRRYYSSNKFNEGKKEYRENIKKVQRTIAPLQILCLHAIKNKYCKFGIKLFYPFKTMYKIMQRYIIYEWACMILEYPSYNYLNVIDTHTNEITDYVFRRIRY
jgi:hypothetical protein